MFRELRIVIGLVVLMLFAVELLKRLDCTEKHRAQILAVVTVMYICSLVYFVALRGNRVGLGRVSIKFPLPFWKAIMKRHYGTVTNRSVLNMLLFVPFGYLLLQLKQLKWYQVVGLGFLTSLLIETCQLVFRFGVFELDDLVKNTMGAGLGWLLYAGLDRILRRQ